jgi:LysR family transcriptional regulator, regulator for metE and metH
MIEREHLQIILALDRTGTLTRAADELHLTQSALSHAMRRLEERTGATLWKRQGRRLRLTEAGRYLLDLARRIAPQLRDADRELERFATGGRGTLRVGMECHPCYEWLLTLLPDFLRSHPGVEIDVIQRFQFSGIDALAHHEVDVVITPDPVGAPGIVFEPALPYELRLAAAADISIPSHETATERWIDADVFSGLDLLIYPVPRDRLDVFTRLLIPAGIEPRSTKAVEATEVMLELVRAGRGVTTLPDWMVGGLGPEVRSYRLGREGIHKTLALGHRASDAGIVYLRDLIELALARRPEGRQSTSR